MWRTRGIGHCELGENWKTCLTSLQINSPAWVRPHVNYMNHGLGPWLVRANIKWLTTYLYIYSIFVWSIIMNLFFFTFKILTHTPTHMPSLMWVCSDGKCLGPRELQFIIVMLFIINSSSLLKIALICVWYQQLHRKWHGYNMHALFKWYMYVLFYHAINLFNVT